MATLNNLRVDFAELSKNEKLAIFLVAIGTDSASIILNRLDPYDMEEVCKEISKIKLIDNALKKDAIEHFTSVIGDALSSTVGGERFVRKTLEDKSNSEELLSRISPRSGVGAVVQQLTEMSPLQIYSLLKSEQAQTAAFLLSQLRVEKVSTVMEFFPSKMRTAILEQMGQMKTVPVEKLFKFAKSLGPRTVSEEAIPSKECDGISLVAEILNSMERDESREFLDSLNESNPALSAEISKRMFSFADLVKLSTADLQRVAREVDMNDLVLSLKVASKELMNAIMKSVSKRAAESIKEELEMLGPTKVKVIEEAQERIINIVKRLEEDGAIEIDQGGGGGDEVV